MGNHAIEIGKKAVKWIKGIIKEVTKGVTKDEMMEEKWKRFICITY